MCKILLFILFPLLIFAQTLQNDRKVLKAALHMTDSSKIIYVAKSKWGTGESYNLKNHVESRKYKDLVGQKNSIRLSKVELSDIIKEIEKNKNFIWPEGLFINSEITQNENAEAYFAEKNKIAEKNKGDGKTLSGKEVEDTLQDDLLGVHLFSKPIYIREQTICLLFMEMDCGSSCGNGGFYFFKKINNKWVQWVCISFFNV